MQNEQTGHEIDHLKDVEIKAQLKQQDSKKSKRERILNAIYKAQSSSNKPAARLNASNGMGSNNNGLSARQTLKANLRQNLVEKQARKTQNVFQNRAMSL